MEDEACSDSPDPVNAAAAALLGVKYLYPYQRLVVANILEAAEAAGMAVEWPAAAPGLERQTHAAEETAAVEERGEREDAAGLGRQIVILPTGAGKSLCFQLPALLLPRPTLVLYPILSLMSDQARRLAEKGFQPVVLRGGQDAEERRRIWNRLGSGDARFVIANPEVLLTESVMNRLSSVGFGHLVVDEAHCVSEWGESFRPSYLRIAEILRAAAAPLATAFTATASPQVLDKIRGYIFADASARLIVANPDRPNIDYSAVGTLLRDRAVADMVEREARPSVVFCSSRSRTEQLARLLRSDIPFLKTRFYHAGLSREEKDETERWFFSSGDGVLTATCAYGLGVDKADIRTVIHRDCPPNVEAYLQESGRAGRDGKPARAILLWGPEDSSALSRAEEGANRERLSRLLDYARRPDRCRRETLLELLGADCGYCPGCDSCRGEASPDYRERAALEGFVERNRRRYTEAEAAGIIAARNGNGWTTDDAKTALRRLEREGILCSRSGVLWRGKLDLPQSSARKSSSRESPSSSAGAGAACFLGVRTFFGLLGRGRRLTRAT